MEAITLRGKVGRVFFSNPSGPFMAGTLEPDDTKTHTGAVRFSGKLAANVGDKLELVGDWTEHPRFGRQFDAKTALIKMDESPDALAHLLASDDRFRGLGPVRAKRVVEAALALSDGGDMAQALRDHTWKIAERAGCPVDVVENAAEVWNSKKAHFEALAQLCEQGWSNAQAQSILHRFGEGAPALVRADPYMLIGKIARFGFRTVDAIARRLGVPSNDPNRLMTGVAYCLDEMGSNGNTWTTRDGLVENAIQELRPDTLDGEDRIRDALKNLIASGMVVVEHAPNGIEVVADAALAAAEFDVFWRLIEGLDDRHRLPSLNLTGPRCAAVIGTLNKGQAHALACFSSSRFSVISGGAGSGKTYTMRAICEAAEENGLVVALAAPTGKAARRLAHLAERPASTVHRLLEPIFDETSGQFRFRRGPACPIEADLIVIDEVSMMDVKLMRSLLVAIAPDTRLLLVGDHNQIPSVSPGAILRDILSAEKRFGDSVTILREIVRQAGVLARNTCAILDGLAVTQTTPSWGITKTEKGSEEAAATMAAALFEALVTAPEPLQPFGRQLDPAWDVQVLSPMKKGPLGTHALNVELQKLRQRLLGNPPPPALKADERPKPLVGDRVIWTENDYTLDLFNGTQGIVLGLEKGGAMRLFIEDGREVVIPPEKRSRVDLAYALTIHKAQGSQWPCVILVASSAHYIMHDRNLLYTGASRAAESLTILGDMNGLRHFAAERKSAERQTFGAFIVRGWLPTSTAQALPGFGDPQAAAQ